ncbi:MAG: response regulator transcription factor [Cyanobacteriota bacterium]
MNEKESPRILLVEDNAVIREKLEQLLVLKKYDVIAAKTGSQALDIINKTDKFHLVILDVMIPEPNGWELLIRIKSNPRTESWPVIMLTAIDDETSEANALYDGASDYITKPFRTKTLLARIESLIKRPPSISSESIVKNHDLPPLTDREKEVLICLTEGLSNNEIADRLTISRTTVEAHLKNIFAKLNVENRTQAAVLGVKCNLI